MSGQVTSDLYAVVDLSNKKTKKPASNQDEDSSDPDNVMHDVLNRNDRKDNREATDNKPHLSTEKPKFCQFVSPYKVMIFILIITWIILITAFVLVINVYLSMGNQKQNDSSINSLVRKNELGDIKLELYTVSKIRLHI